MRCFTSLQLFLLNIAIRVGEQCVVATVIVMQVGVDDDIDITEDMNISIFGFNQAYAGVMVGIMDIFNQAKKLLISQGRRAEADKIRTNLVSVDGKPILFQNNLLLKVQNAVEDIRDADIFIVTSIAAPVSQTG